MDEQTALAMLSEIVGEAGDDAAVIDGHVLSIDMLHDRTDFPDGVSRYTAGWRAAGASLSDIAAMGATPIATVAAYGAPRFEQDDLTAFITGAQDVSDRANAAYVGGDLDHHDEFTVATAALGRVDHPVHRSGAHPEDRVFVTGTFGRTAAGIDRFDAGDIEEGNDLFRFLPRTEIAQQVAPEATAMMDSSDGLARSLHQLAAASGCGFDIVGDAVPVHPALHTDPERALYFGEDFELVLTAPAASFESLSTAVSLTEIGRVTGASITIDGEELPDRGYEHR